MPICSFEKISLVDYSASEKYGRTSFMDGIQATIHIDSKNNVCFQFPFKKETESFAEFMNRVHPEIRSNYRKELENWLDGNSDVVNGTRVDAMPWLSPSQVANLKSVGVNTVELLVNSSDGILTPLSLNGPLLRKQAKAWLDNVAGENTKTINLLHDENEKLKERLEALEASISSKNDSVEDSTMQAIQPHRGRPKGS